MENDSINVQGDEVTVSDTAPEITEVGDMAHEAENEAREISAESEPSRENEEDGGGVDEYAYYEKLARDDLLEIKREFIEASDIKDISELDNPERFCELRELGLTPTEAYLATQKKRADNRSHLKSRVPTPASAPRLTLSQRELEAARELFCGISDAEIQELYKKVSR